ncbi:metallophosphoesterase family protein [Sphingomonas soli]|uniref:metallophosphoesterase family protein n=1 Tax=Sphingomonas soli TaxID=266127 RepID=UPI000832D72A|nr:metallophosphoesterase family protein [Sphingomonas soli]
MSRIAVLSDIHGNLAALKAVVADAEGQGCTQFLNLGDILSGPLWPAETADFLMARGWPTIAGNHERQVLTLPPERTGPSDAFARECLSEAHIAWVASLPETLSLPGMLLVHGTPRSDVEHFLETVDPGGIRHATEAEIAERLGDAAVPLTLCGHTHVVRQVRLADGRLVANAGSVGLQAFDDDHLHPYRVENGDPRARYLIVEFGAVTIHTVGYDYEAAAAKAAREGREDWAVALRTGRMTA